LGAELEERSLLEGSELVVLVFACCFSCSCSCAAIFLLSTSPPTTPRTDQDLLLPPASHHSFPDSCFDSASSPRGKKKRKRKIKSLRTPEGTGDKGGRKKSRCRSDERERTRGRGRREKRVCVRDGNGRGGRGEEMEVGGVGRFWMRRHPRRARHPPSYGRGRGSVAWRGTIHASTASDGDLLNA